MVYQAVAPLDSLTCLCVIDLIYRSEIPRRCLNLYGRKPTADKSNWSPEEIAECDVAALLVKGCWGSFVGSAVMRLS